jgi:hypothetical protein
MKALPLWQPWASLVALGAKRVETRHWKAPESLIGQRIAIHATKTARELWIADTEPFRTHLRCLDSPLPLGAIVATVVLKRCCVMTSEGITLLRQHHPDEYAFGNYAVDRFAWVLAEVIRLDTPVAFKGSQGIFAVPDDLIWGA